MSRRVPLLVVLCFMLMAVLVGACKPGTPKKYIQPKKMEDILVDYHLARAMADNSSVRDEYGSRDYTQQLLIEAVLKKYNVTKAQFDSSLVYYYTRADRFKPMYDRVAQRLEERALAMGASEGEIGKYANATGDTANIWADRSQLLMLPRPPYNRTDFEIAGDSLFKEGDKVLFQFIADYMVQAGNRDAVLYMAFHMNDTTIARSQRINSSGLNKLEYTTPNGKLIKSLDGYILFPAEDPNTSTARMLFINNIQLIRFHTKQDNEKPATLPNTENSLPQAVDGRPVSDEAHGPGTTEGGRRQVVSVEPGNSPDGVPVRKHKP